MSPLLLFATKNRRNRRGFTCIWKILWHQSLTITASRWRDTVSSFWYRFFHLKDRCFKFWHFLLFLLFFVATTMPLCFSTAPPILQSSNPPILTPSAIPCAKSQLPNTLCALCLSAPLREIKQIPIIPILEKSGIFSDWRIASECLLIGANLFTMKQLKTLVF